MSGGNALTAAKKSQRYRNVWYILLFMKYNLLEFLLLLGFNTENMEKMLTSTSLFVPIPRIFCNFFDSLFLYQFYLFLCFFKRTQHTTKSKIQYTYIGVFY